MAGLRELLDARGMTPAALAEGLNGSTSSVYYWLNKCGDAPPLDRLAEVGKVLSLTDDELEGLKAIALARLGLKAA